MMIFMTNLFVVINWLSYSRHVNGFWSCSSVTSPSSPTSLEPCGGMMVCEWWES